VIKATDLSNHSVVIEIGTRNRNRFDEDVIIRLLVRPNANKFPKPLYSETERKYRFDFAPLFRKSRSAEPHTLTATLF
jgi:hypothetical protein